MRGGQVGGGKVLPALPARVPVLPLAHPGRHPGPAPPPALTLGIVLLCYLGLFVTHFFSTVGDVEDVLHIVIVVVDDHDAVVLTAVRLRQV